MKLLTSLKDLKLGQLVAWRALKYIGEEEAYWYCISKVNGFHKKTTYPQKINGLVYQTTEYITYDIMAKSNKEDWGMGLFLTRYDYNGQPNKRGSFIQTEYNYDNKMFEAWLIENEEDYLTVLKHLVADSL